MKTIKLFTLVSLFLFNILNPIFSQKLIKGTPTHAESNMVEIGSDNDAIIGIGTPSPQAKVHITWHPITTQPTFKIDAVPTVGPGIGSVEGWRVDGGIYYGIYQTQTGSNIIPKNYFQNNLGLGVLNPAYQLDVNGIIGCTGNNATGIHISNTNHPFVFQYYSANGGGLPDELTDGESEPVEGSDTTLSPLTIYAWGVKVQNNLECSSFFTTNSLKIRNNPHIGSLFICNDQEGNGSWTDPSVFSITSGNVRIGTADEYPDYKLAVNGKILCTEMKVKLYSQWPDYVFNRDYNLRTLQEVDQYIRTNKHLPDLPSAEEVTETGINVGEMNAKLVKKVEELTLYIIALQREMDQLKSKVSPR